jgi:hypothetical protein
MIAFEWKKFVNKEAFIEQVNATALVLDIKPDWLMMVFYLESGFRRTAQNPHSRAIGLLQWLPSTAKGLGVSTTAIANMSGVEQVKLAERYFWPYRGKIHNFYDCYFAVFSPKGIGKPDTHLLYSNDTNGYKWNAVLDTKYGNHNGKLEVVDVKRYAYSRAMQAAKAADWPKNFKFPFE